MEQFDSAVAAFEQADYLTAFYLFFPLAMEGNAAAQSYIDKLRESGRGIPADYEGVWPWQDSGDEAELDFATLDSLFGALDYETYLFFEGVKNDVGDASNHLDYANYLFEFENDIPDERFVQSRKHMELAARGGNVIAQWNMAEGGGLADALTWYAVLADRGSLTAKYKLALRHLYWIGSPESLELGLSLCREAAKGGNRDAQRELAKISGA